MAWATCWRKGVEGLPGRRHCLLVARHVLTNAVNDFLGHRVPGEPGLSWRRWRRVAVGRWSVESCFRQANEELGLDQDAVRGWRGLDRHGCLTPRTHRFGTRLRQQFDDATTPDAPLEHLTTEHVRRASNTWLAAAQGRRSKAARCQRELVHQQYYQRRKAQAQRSPTNRRRAQRQDLGMDADRIKSCMPSSPT